MSAIHLTVNSAFRQRSGRPFLYHHRRSLLGRESSLPARLDFRLIGKRTSRIDARDHVSGATKYGIDTRVPGMLYASIERPTAFGATAKSGMKKRGAPFGA